MFKLPVLAIKLTAPFTFLQPWANRSVHRLLPPFQFVLSFWARIKLVVGSHAYIWSSRRNRKFVIDIGTRTLLKKIRLKQELAIPNVLDAPCLNPLLNPESPMSSTNADRIRLPVNASIPDPENTVPPANVISSGGIGSTLVSFGIFPLSVIPACNGIAAESGI